VARIDVTELLADPDFVDEMRVITRTPVISSYGEQTLSETTEITVGSIQSPTGNVLQRLPEALRALNVQSFWVRGRIKADASTSQYPDLLYFAGRYYEVQKVFDWTNWGSGWCEGVCIVRTPGGT
jgi:hypothetical protein